MSILIIYLKYFFLKIILYYDTSKLTLTNKNKKLTKVSFMKKTPSRTGGVQTTKRKQTNCTAGNKAKISLDRLMIMNVQI